MPELIPSEVIRKLARLRAMSPRELSHRVRGKVYSEVDRIIDRIGTGGQPAAVRVPFKDYLAGAPADRFYRGHTENPRSFIHRKFPQWIDRAVDEADKLCRHEMTLLGYGPVELGPEIDWHRDPVTGRVWERRFWADYRPVQDSGGRDAKIIHELNRHQHLPRLAKAYLLTGDERYASEAVAQLNSWIDQNPPGRGINWQSSLEIAIRAISWLWTIFPLLPSRSFDETSAQRIGDSLFAQLEHVHRYTSLYSSPNTHLIGESAALFIAGLVFRDSKRPAIWLRRAAARLTEAAEKQVLDDGVYGELSSCYHCYALDFYLQATVLAEQNGFLFPEPVPHRVRGMLQFLMHLTRPDGTLPSLGDDDGGRALALDKRDYHSFQDGLCLGAILYRRGDFKHQAGAFCEEALWMLGEDAWEVYRQLESREPAESEAYYPCAGYLVQRSGWGPLDSHLVFDCGGLGMLAGAHAHADTLSVTLFSRGQELLVDPGTFAYNCAPEWRNYFRSTPAHNTVTIDGLDQAEQGGTFHWKTKIRSRAARDFTSPGIGYVEAEHDGYRRMPQGVIHRRRLLFVPPESWIVVDDFRGSGEHTFDFHYHFPADAEVSAPHLCLIASEPVKTARIAGWMSRGYGEKKPCTTLRATFAGPVPAAAMTFLLPDGSCDHVVRRLTVESGSGIACSYKHDGFEDIAILSTGDSEMAVADFRARGEFFWLRLEGGVLKQVLAVRARSLDRAGRNIFRRSEPGPYFGVIDAGLEEKSLCAELVES
jgi:Heparinase II/III-like protein/Heparinase II/III N-terminus